MFCLIKKLLELKCKDFKAKSINQELVELTNYLCHVLMIKDMCQMMEFIRWLNFTNCKNIKKDCDKKERIRKDCDKKDCEEIKKACDKKDCEKTSCQSWDEFSSNIDEVIKTVLNFFILFLRENFTRTKRTKAQKVQKHQRYKMYKKHKSTKSTKSIKSPKRK